MSTWERVVVTAFGPVGGDTVNASECLLRHLEAHLPERLAPWRECIALEYLPAAEGPREELDRQAADLLARHGPALYLLTGQAAGRARFSLEQLAVNRYQGRPITEDGPPAYLADVPGWAELPEALRRAGIPARASRDPGEGACNHLLYTLLHAASREGVGLRAGLLHIPLTPEQAARSGDLPSWPTAFVAAGVRALLERLLAHLPRAGAAGAPWAGARLVRLDHWVLPVTDLERSARFYTRVLGMDLRVDARGRYALHFGRHRIDLRPHPDVTLPQARRTEPGATDLCLLTDQPLPRFIAHLMNEGVAVEEGPVQREGAEGVLLSVYFRDPDGNLLEVANRIGRRAAGR